jgi:hypothetical protein
MILFTLFAVDDAFLTRIPFPVGVAFARQGGVHR